MAELRLVVHYAAWMTVRFACLLIGMVIACGLCKAEAADTVTIPASSLVVVDGAKVLDAGAIERISALFVHLRELTMVEVKVLTVTTTGGEDLPGFAQRHYDVWQLGQRGKDNGALIVLTITEHQVRIHTGYGLEATLPDSWCGSLSRSVAMSHFKSGKYGDGLEVMARAVAARIADAEHVDLKLDAASRFTPNNTAIPQFPWMIIIFIIVAIFFVLRKRRTTGFAPSPWIGSYGGFGGNGSSGGGGFGGGFSGGGGRSGGGGGGAGW